ncbi:MAG: UxaA family hydrolase [Pseudomonadota bacterium]
MTTPTIDAIQLTAEDNVATMLRAVRQGEEFNVKGPDGIKPYAAAEPLPLCHKLALEPMKAGVQVRKYGKSIGTLTTSVARGALVHVHNMASNRGRQR